MSRHGFFYRHTDKDGVLARDNGGGDGHSELGGGARNAPGLGHGHDLRVGSKVLRVYDTVKIIEL